MIVSPTVSFGCTALVGTNKRGILKCDERGYYPVVLGALNHYNSGGAYYPAAPARQLFDASAALQRRIATGALNGECGHPRKQAMDSDRDFAYRLNDIYEPNISHHIRKIWLEEGHKDEMGRAIVLIMGEVKPAGPRGPALKEALENPDQDVCFSIRSFTNDIPVGMIIHKYLKQVVTFDWVNEPGISAAHKWRAPSLESFEEYQLTRELVVAMATQQRASAYGLESANARIDELVEAMGWNTTSALRLPPSASW